MPKTRLNVNVSGPLFDGSAEAVVTQWLDATKKDVADLGVTEIKGRAAKFNRSHRGTGHYATTINTRENGAYHDQVISDGGVIYGPWLEGTSKRNDSTRFKGYHQFRRTRTKLKKLYSQVAQDKLKEYIDRMGGSES